MDFFAYFDIELRIGGTVVADGVGNEAADSGAVGDAGRLRRRRQEAAVPRGGGVATAWPVAITGVKSVGETAK